MKRLLLLFVYVIFSYGQVLAECDNWSVSGGGSAGWLWKSGAHSIPLYTGGIDAVFQGNSTSFFVSGGYAFLSSNFSALEGKADCCFFAVFDV